MAGPVVAGHRPEITRCRTYHIFLAAARASEVAIQVDKWQHVQLVLSRHGPSSGSERLVLLAISADTNNSQSECWPSQERIAERSQLSLRQVKRLVKSAEEHGWLTRRKARKPGATWSFTVYALTVPQSLLDVVPQHPWEVDPEWKQGAKTVAPSFEQGAETVARSFQQGAKTVAPSTPQEGSPNGCKVTSSGSEVTSTVSKVTNDGQSKVTNQASNVPSRWPTTFPSDVPRDDPQYEPTHGPTRTARAGTSERIREDDPEVRRRRREAARLVEQLAARLTP